MIAIACFVVGFLLGLTVGMRIAESLVNAMRRNLEQMQHQGAELNCESLPAES
jgi:hypothetical protein